MRGTSSSSRPRTRTRSSDTSSAASLGGPLSRGRTFFFAAYEGLRQRQGLDMNSLVLSDEQRAAATDPVIRQLIQFIPRANYFDAAGRRDSSARRRAVVDMRSAGPSMCGTTLGGNDRAPRFLRKPARPGHRADRRRATASPGSGNCGRPLTQHPDRQRDAHLRRRTLNEARFGRSRLGGRQLSGDAAQSSGLRHRQRGRRVRSGCRR